MVVRTGRLRGRNGPHYRYRANLDSNPLAEMNTFPCIGPRELRTRILGAGELALIDVREALAYAAGHILYAANLPLSRFELIAGRALPRARFP